MALTEQELKKAEALKKFGLKKEDVKSILLSDREKGTPGAENPGLLNRAATGFKEGIQREKNTWSTYKQEQASTKQQSSTLREQLNSAGSKEEWQNTVDKFMQGGGDDDVLRRAIVPGPSLGEVGETIAHGARAVARPAFGAIGGAAEPITEPIAGTIKDYGEKAFMPALKLITPDKVEDATASGVKGVAQWYANQSPETKSFIERRFGDAEVLFGAADIYGAKQIVKSVGKKVGTQTFKDAAGTVNAGIKQSIYKTYGVAKQAAPLAEPLAKGAGGILKGAGKVAAAPFKAIGSTAELAIAKASGLSDDTLKVFKEIPEIFEDVQKGNISREMFGEQVANKMNVKRAELSDIGKEYNTVRELPDMISVPSSNVNTLLKNKGIEMKDGLAQGITKRSHSFNDADLKMINTALDKISDVKSMGVDEWLNTRRAWDDLIGWDKSPGTSKGGKDFVKSLRDDLNNVAHTDVPELKSVDNQFSPKVRELKAIEKEFFTFNKDGQKVLKDNALTKMVNLTKPGRKEKLSLMEEAIPGFGNKVRAIKALEDVEIRGQKVGSYLQSALIGGGVLGGATFGAKAAVPAIGIAILANPAIAAPLLVKYSKSKKWSKAAVNKVVSKIKTGAKLSVPEKQMVEETIDGIEKQARAGKLEKSVVKDVVDEPVVQDTPITTQTEVSSKRDWREDIPTVKNPDVRDEAFRVIEDAMKNKKSIREKFEEFKVSIKKSNKNISDAEIKEAWEEALFDLTF